MQQSTTVSSPVDINLDASVRVSGAESSPESSTVCHTPPTTAFEAQGGVLANTLGLDHAAGLSRDSGQGSFLSSDGSVVGDGAYLDHDLRRHVGFSITVNEAESEATSTADLISRDIKLTTSMDKLTARTIDMQPSFSFFLESVDCPAITPYDVVNWRYMKLEMIKLANSNMSITAAILAVSALLSAQLYSLPLSKALFLCESSRSAYEELLAETTQHFDIILVATLLLCLFEFHHYETEPLLKEPSQLFLKRLGIWAGQESSHSELSLRIVQWLQLLHANTLRAGGAGIISEEVYGLFPGSTADTPILRRYPEHHADASSHLYDMLSTPIINFYFQLQMISLDIAKLTHYHRPRTTGMDQDEVVRSLCQIKSRLHALWETRSATQRQTPEDLRSHLSPIIAKPIIALIGVCMAAYYAEFIEIDRVLGDPISDSRESKQSRQRIREIVEGDWNVRDDGKVNPGFLRPLFLYAIECMDHDENKWAVKRLEEIRNPIYRSDFFAAFATALSDAQLRKERRVTSNTSAYGFLESHHLICRFIPNSLIHQQAEFRTELDPSTTTNGFNLLTRRL